MAGLDPYDLTRFVHAQEGVYATVLAELKSGKKRTHWMWFIFPQVDGLGFSSTTRYYAIKSVAEARQYLQHPLLGKRLWECVDAVLAIEGRAITEIFDYPDDLKLHSSMTLFAGVAEEPGKFIQVLDRYFQGERDKKTIQILEKLTEK